VVATKGANTRHGPDIWRAVGRPEYLRQCVLMSMRRLGVERIDLWQLHRIDHTMDRDVQFAAIAEMQKEGLMRHVCPADVTVEESEAARKHSPVVSVQNLSTPVYRKSEHVLECCDRQNLGFIPRLPLAAGDLAREGTVLDDTAKKLGATRAQVALA